MDPHVARARLLEERAAVLGMEQDLASSFEDIVDAARDSNLDDEHDPEGSTIAAERQLVAALSHSATERLGQIDAALARLDLGSYGRCERCSEVIGEGRLEARPAATLCITCAGGGRPPGRSGRPR